MTTLLCERHQKEVQRLGTATFCSQCLAEVSVIQQKIADNLDERLLIKKWDVERNKSCIPERFKESSFKNFQSESIRATALCRLLEAYVFNFTEQSTLRTGFVFTGLQGRGKTHLACAMANGLMYEGYSARYANLPKLTQRARKTYRGNSDESVSDIVEELVETDFLILDEVDLHGSSDADYQMLYDIINGRYEKPGYPTLLISNMPIEKLNIDLNERLISRVLSGSPAIVFDWDSYRDALPERVRENGRKL